MAPLARLLVVAAVLGGCAPSGAAPSERGRVPLVTVEGRIAPRVENPFKLQTLVTANDVTALNAASSTIEVYIERAKNTAFNDEYTGQTKLGTMAGASRKLTLRNLWPDRYYRVTLRAFKADPNDPNQSVQMTTDASNTTLIDTKPVSGTYDAAKVVTFSLTLTDQVFQGVATSTAPTNVSVTSGAILDPTASEALVTP